MLQSQSGLFEVATKDQRGKRKAAQYVNLTNARAYFCPSGHCQIAGFFTEIASGKSATRKAKQAAFVVTDAADADAMRQGFPQDVGIITAAFYRPTKKSVARMGAEPAFGTKQGVVRDQQVQVYQGETVPGELLAVVHLRYGLKPK